MNYYVLIPIFFIILILVGLGVYFKDNILAKFKGKECEKCKECPRDGKCEKCKECPPAEKCEKCKECPPAEKCEKCVQKPCPICPVAEGCPEPEACPVQKPCPSFGDCPSCPAPEPCPGVQYLNSGDTVKIYNIASIYGGYLSTCGTSGIDECGANVSIRSDSSSVAPDQIEQRRQFKIKKIASGDAIVRYGDRIIITSISENGDVSPCGAAPNPSICGVNITIRQNYPESDLREWIILGGVTGHPVQLTKSVKLKGASQKYEGTHSLYMSSCHSAEPDICGWNVSLRKDQQQSDWMITKV